MRAPLRQEVTIAKPDASKESLYGDAHERDRKQNDKKGDVFLPLA